MVNDKTIENHFCVCAISLEINYWNAHCFTPVVFSVQTGVVLHKRIVVSADSKVYGRRKKVGINILCRESRDQKRKSNWHFFLEYMGGKGRGVSKFYIFPDGGRQKPRSSLKPKGRHIDNLLVTGCTRGCHSDNLRCNQWRNGCQYDDLFVFSTYLTNFTERVSHNQVYHKSHCHVIRPFLSKNTKYDLIFHWNLNIIHPGT